jgi:hypothetical protein
MFEDRRFSGRWRWSYSPPRDDGMRIPDTYLNCVVFLGQRRVENGKEILNLGGTAFMIGVEDAWCNLHYYLVTARHSILELEGREYLVRANTTDGHFKEVTFKGDEKWWYHPTEEESVDVAVIPWKLADDDATSCFTPEEFLTDEKRVKEDIGIGDAVYTVGLFTKLRGEQRNTPIVRSGAIAMMPQEMLPDAKIGNWRGPIDAILIEARSVGGLSGSPVFVRESRMDVEVIHDQEGEDFNKTEAVGSFWHLHLLGLAHGHWEIFPDDKNNVRIWSVTKEDRSINLGIAVVVPAKKILETLNHPELQALRIKEGRAIYEADGETTPD